MIRRWKSLCILLFILDFILMTLILIKSNRQTGKTPGQEIFAKQAGTAVQSKPGKQDISVEQEPGILDEQDNSTKQENPVNYEVKEHIFRSDGIEAHYPNLSSETSGINTNEWNRIIMEDFIQILGIYTYEPFPELETPADLPAITLKLNYEIKRRDNRFFSIFYKADYFSPYAAHPSQLVYTTNIDLQNNKRLQLSDLVRLDQKFAELFKNWDYIPFEEGNEELDRAIRDYLKGLSEEELLKGFQAADIIGADNSSGIFSYLTPDRMGISLSVPHYIGDHLEFEKEFSLMKDFLITR